MKRIISLSAILLILFLSQALTSQAFASSSERFNQGVVTWNLVYGAKCYNIYYRRTTQTNWTHSVKCVPNNMWQYTIHCLKQGVSYVYAVAALNYAGKEISWTPITPLVSTPQ